jgi:antitoxin ParD1/3/4
MSEPAEWPDPAEKAYAIAQAKQLRDQAAKGGLRFEAYLPPDLALWLLDRIEQGVFVDPSEAAFVLLGEAQELEPHADLRGELLKRGIQAAIDDPRPAISHEPVMAEMRDKLQQPRPEPATWEKRSRR